MVRMASNPVNCINPAFLDQLDATLERLEGENASSQPSPVVFASASGDPSIYSFINLISFLISIHYFFIINILSCREDVLCGAGPQDGAGHVP